MELLVTDLIIRKTQRRWKMEHRISILFYARKSKMTKDKLVPIYACITVNGQRIEHSIQRYVRVARWGAAPAVIMNDYTDMIRIIKRSGA